MVGFQVQLTSRLVQKLVGEDDEKVLPQQRIQSQPKSIEMPQSLPQAPALPFPLSQSLPPPAPLQRFKREDSDDLEQHTEVRKEEDAKEKQQEEQEKQGEVEHYKGDKYDVFDRRTTEDEEQGGAPAIKDEHELEHRGKAADENTQVIENLKREAEFLKKPEHQKEDIGVAAESAEQQQPVEVARDLQPLMRVLEKNEKYGEELQKKGLDELEVMKKRAEELKQKHFNEPAQRTIPCLTEREECIKCYKKLDPVRCKVEADAYVRCTAEAFKSTVS